MIHHEICILVAVSLRPQETTFDQYLQAFSSIAPHGEKDIAATADPNGQQPHFTFEIRVGMPLLGIALKCRDSLIHKALALLRQAMDKETKRLQYVTVDNQETAEFGLITARKKWVTGTNSNDFTIVEERVQLRI